jgi:hypothetical protein
MVDVATATRAMRPSDAPEAEEPHQLRSFTDVAAEYTRRNPQDPISRVVAFRTLQHAQEKIWAAFFGSDLDVSQDRPRRRKPQKIDRWTDLSLEDAPMAPKVSGRLKEDRKQLLMLFCATMLTSDALVEQET